MRFQQVEYTSLSCFRSGPPLISFSFWRLCFKLFLIFCRCIVLLQVSSFSFFHLFILFFLSSLYFRWDGPASTPASTWDWPLVFKLELPHCMWGMVKRMMLVITFLLPQLSTKVMTSKNSRMNGPLSWVSGSFGFLPGKFHFFFFFSKFFFVVLVLLVLQIKFSFSSFIFRHHKRRTPQNLMTPLNGW